MLLAEPTGSIWSLAGVVVAMLLLLFTFWRINRRAAGRSEPPASPPGLADRGCSGLQEPEAGWFTGRALSADAPASLLAWEVHMHETAREVSAQIDTKLRLLQQLVAEADRAATRLERALAAVQTATAEPPRSGCAEPANPSPSEGATARPSPIQSEATSNPLPLGNPDQTTAPPSPVRPEALDLEVGLLADYGFPLQEIASRCGITVSEVETILQRRRPQRWGPALPPNPPGQEKSA